MQKTVPPLFQLVIWFAMTNTQNIWCVSLASRKHFLLYKFHINFLYPNGGALMKDADDETLTTEYF